MSYRIYHEALRYSRGPYSWEFITRRPVGEQYRIRDSRDDAVGSADSTGDAQIAVTRLNGTSA